MPLFVCDECHAIDNSACGGNFWDRLLEDGLKATSGKILCAECYAGTWHGQFTKRIYKLGDEKCSGGIEYIPKSLKPKICHACKCKIDTDGCGCNPQDA